MKNIKFKKLKKKHKKSIIIRKKENINKNF